MLKRLLIAAAIAIVSPAWISAQDIFLSFDSEQLVTTFNLNDPLVLSGSVYIFSDGLFGFDALDLNFSAGDSNAIQFTGGEAFNPVSVIGPRFDSTEITISPDGSAGNLLAFRILGTGVNPDFRIFDPLFVPDIGPDGAVLLARVDFEIVGGIAKIVPTLGPFGSILFPAEPLDPSLGGATLVAQLQGLVIGDINSDGLINFLDIQPFIEALSSPTYRIVADINCDGAVNFFDIQPFIDLLSNP